MGIVDRELSSARQIRSDCDAHHRYLRQAAQQSHQPAEHAGGRSPLYAGAAPTRQVEQAIARLGINSTRHLVMAHAVRSTFVTRSALLTSLMQRTWASSTRLAALCGVLAKHCSSFRPESATLAGLLQDIGVLPILHVLNPYHEQLSNEAQVSSAIDKFAPPVGTILLTRWGFDADMVEVARSRGNWLRNPQPAADLADVVLVARLHACITSGNEDP